MYALKKKKRLHIVAIRVCAHTAIRGLEVKGKIDRLQHGSSDKAVVCQGNTTALSGKAALFVLEFECNPKSRQANWTALYTDTTLLRTPYWDTPTVHHS